MQPACRDANAVDHLPQVGIPGPSATTGLILHSTVSSPKLSCTQPLLLIALHQDCSSVLIGRQNCAVCKPVLLIVQLPCKAPTTLPACECTGIQFRVVTLHLLLLVMPLLGSRPNCNNTHCLHNANTPKFTKRTI